MSDDRRLLWGYPAAWRERYGAELLALVEDTTAGRGPTRSVRASLLVAGVKERLRAAALIGRDRSPTERIRAGSRVILVAWAILVIAGCGFAKFSEHWQAAVPSHDRLVPGLAYGVILVAAAVGALALAGVTAMALPSIRRALAAGRWGSMRGPVLVAVGVIVATAGATAGVALWGRHLTPTQRNGSYGPYLLAFVGWGLLVVATIAACTLAAIAVERHLDVSAPLVRAMAIAARAISVSTVLIAGAILMWWIALARSAPWALAGSQRGAVASPWAWPLAGEAALAMGAGLLAVLGATRLASAARSSRHAR